ncbi:MAG: hypothetical protein CVU43_22780, partial [Chloroflexi bacterium HGW-Chloroflexi-5]
PQYGLYICMVSLFLQTLILNTTMKNTITRHQKYKTLHRILTENPQAFEGKPEAMAMLASLGDCNDQLSQLISKLIRPVSTVYQPRQNLRINFIESLKTMNGACILIATRINNNTLKAIMKQYRVQISRVADYTLYEMAVHIAEELKPYSGQAEDIGLDTVKLTEFTRLTNDFLSILDDTGMALNTRRVGRSEIHSLLKACNQLIVNQVDHFVIMNGPAFPEMKLAYMSVRKPRRSRKSDPEIEANGDISGTVTNSITGVSIGNASITLLQHASVNETDIDGYYLFEELEEGTYTVGCFAHGYQVPEAVEVTIQNNESLVVDFNLIPVDPVLN